MWSTFQWQAVCWLQRWIGCASVSTLTLEITGRFYLGTLVCQPWLLATRGPSRACDNMVNPRGMQMWWERRGSIFFSLRWVIQVYLPLPMGCPAHPPWGLQNVLPPPTPNSQAWCSLRRTEFVLRPLCSCSVLYMKLLISRDFWWYIIIQYLISINLNDFLPLITFLWPQWLPCTTTSP